MRTDLEISDGTLIRPEDNPATRVPVCLVLDCSPSMSGNTDYGSLIDQTDPSPIQMLNKGVARFFLSVKEDPVARNACEISIVAFWGNDRRRSLSGERLGGLNHHSLHHLALRIILTAIPAPNSPPGMIFTSWLHRQNRPRPISPL